MMGPLRMIRMVTPENTPIFPSEENWLGFRGRLSFPSGQGTMPASRLQTVFSITHSDHLMLHTGFVTSQFWKRLRATIAK
jgi:hypothetical protein